MFKIAYVTSSRADYGIVRNFLKRLNEDERIALEIIVTGAIIDQKYGENYHIIENDGLKIVQKVDIKVDATSNETVINSMSIALKEFGSFFERKKYDLVILLGDRYEMISVAIAAAMNRLKILHIHGGEKTLGNYDEFIRHSITKMSTFHYTSTEEYKNRVIQLGEKPEYVFNIGAMGAENCKKINLENVSKKVLELEARKYFTVLFHPETLTGMDTEEQMQDLIDAISNFIPKYRFVFMGNNADTGSNKIRKVIEDFVAQNNNVIYFENLHPDAYHYLLKNSIALIGNSSSGIIEAPTLGTYTINIGDRQKGRVRGSSVIDCEFTDIKNAINKVIKLPVKDEFKNPYYKENASENAYKLTLKILEDARTVIKEFYDL